MDAVGIGTAKKAGAGNGRRSISANWQKCWLTDAEKEHEEDSGCARIESVGLRGGSGKTGKRFASVIDKVDFRFAWMPTLVGCQKRDAGAFFTVLKVYAGTLFGNVVQVRALTALFIINAHDE
jgi:hypothetical protein